MMNYAAMVDGLLSVIVFILVVELKVLRTRYLHFEKLMLEKQLEPKETKP